MAAQDSDSFGVSSSEMTSEATEINEK